MAAATTTLLPPQASYTHEPIFRLSVDQYHELIDSGKLTEDDPVELIEGMLVFKMPKNPPHAAITGIISDLLAGLLGTRWHYRNQEPITLLDGEPEPDGAVVTGTRGEYLERHPGPNDLALVIEVADSTLERDRGIKLRSYARAGIGCYWIVNLIDRQIEVYTQPDAAANPPRYANCEIFKTGDWVPVLVKGQELSRLSVEQILPA
jgi:Uma2 family endonuclease